MQSTVKMEIRENENVWSPNASKVVKTRWFKKYQPEWDLKQLQAKYRENWNSNKWEFEQMGIIAFSKTRN